MTPRVVAALEDYFDMDYPYGKLDVAVVPRYWGTMEHPGIVAMGQPLTLIRPEQETRSRKQAYANILAHELSHYWFGDYVTMAWWDDTWLNEALGEWLDMIITSAVEPSWHYRDERVELATGAMSADETLSTQAIRQPVTTRAAIGSSFDNEITYFKGSSVLRMFEAFAGVDKWRMFIRDYVRARAWGNASADDFIGAMRASLGPPIADGFSSFLSQPGVPRIDVAFHCGAQNEISISQHRSLPAGVSDPVQRSWRLPVCLRYGDRTGFEERCVDLDGPTKTLEVTRCPTWIITNADARGYYRSSIDPKTVRDLLDPKSAIAKIAKPTAVEKIMTIGDLRSMVERNELPIDELLALVPLIASDPDPKIATSALEAARFHSDALDDKLYLAARTWYATTFGPTARSLGWHRAKADSDERHKLRQQHVPMIARNDDKLGREAEKLADRWIADRSGLDDDLVGSALRVAAYRGDAARFDRYLTAAKAARDRSEQQRILSALGAFRDPVLAGRALELLLGHDFDLRDTTAILYGVMLTRENRDLGLAWVKIHIDELLGRMRDDEASWFLTGLAGGFCDVERRQAVGALVATRAAKAEAQAAVTRALEQSDQCIAEITRELPALTRLLSK